MPEVYLASSALKKENFDLLRTIEEAKNSGFDGVQLFINNQFSQEEYLKRTTEELKRSGLGLIVHLPNEVSPSDKNAAEYLVREFPDARVLIHLLPATELPDIEGTLVGWENSMVGKFGPEQVGHIDEVKKVVKKDNTFFVFDFGRMLYLEEEGVGKEEALKFIRDEISNLDPKKDIIHLSDKKSWVLKFRDSMCVLGDGVCGELLEDIYNYSGIVVFEHEDLQMALDSLTVVRDRKNAK